MAKLSKLNIILIILACLAGLVGCTVTGFIFYTIIFEDRGIVHTTTSPDQQYEVTIFMTSSWFGDDFFWFKSRKKSSDAEFYNFYRCEDCLPRDFSSTTALTKPIHTKWSDNKHLQMDVWPTYGECTITLDILEAKQNQNIDCDQNKHVTPSPHQDAG